MMRTIYKYPLRTLDAQAIAMPETAKILTVQMQNGVPTLWAEVETTHNCRPRWFAIVGTGNPMPGGGTKYIATVQQGPFVWHVFELTDS